MTTPEAAFLKRAGWSGADVVPLPSDASDRSYCRVRRADGATAVLMSAPVTTSAMAARQYAAFRRVSDWLHGLGLSAPAELAAEPEAGLLLLEDLGAVSLAALLERAAPDAKGAYGAVVSVLTLLADAPAPDWMDRPDARAMTDMVGLTFSLLPGSKCLAEDLHGILAEELGSIGSASIASLRDVHGDNLIWRPERDGAHRVGLLDFQDALVLPDGYDLASLVDDPRRIVPADWRDDLIRDYATARHQAVDRMARQVDLLSLQRNLRVLGIFRRLATDYGRPDYACFIPRTRALLLRSASHPDLHRLHAPVSELLERTAHWEVEAA
jgi:aminoglycoside/choline kinase family phosphotransferase